MNKNGHQYKALARLTKAQLLNYIELTIDAKDQNCALHSSTIERLTKSLASTAKNLEIEKKKNGHLDTLVDKLTTVSNVIALVVSQRTGHEISAEQLHLLVVDDPNYEPADDNPHDIVERILDNCDSIVEKIGGGNGAPSYDDLAYALEVANGDREELLKRLGLTDFAWSMAGGASYTDVEP